VQQIRLYIDLISQQITVSRIICTSISSPCLLQRTMTTGTLGVVLALILGAAWLLYHQVIQWRYKRFAHIPNKLSTNLFLGHLGHIAAAYKKVGDATVHPGKRWTLTTMTPLTASRLRLREYMEGTRQSGFHFLRSQAFSAPNGTRCIPCYC
jgi:hypothetical protein